MGIEHYEVFRYYLFGSGFAGLGIRDWPSFHLFEVSSGRERTRITVNDAFEGYEGYFDEDGEYVKEEQYLEEYFIGYGRYLVIRANKENGSGTYYLFDPRTGNELSLSRWEEAAGLNFHVTDGSW